MSTISTISTLPKDLIIEIFEYVWEKEKCLASVYLVCKSWYEIARNNFYPKPFNFHRIINWSEVSKVKKDLIPKNNSQKVVLTALIFQEKLGEDLKSFNAHHCIISLHKNLNSLFCINANDVKASDIVAWKEFVFKIELGFLNKNEINTFVENKTLLSKLCSYSAETEVDNKEILYMIERVILLLLSQGANPNLATQSITPLQSLVSIFPAFHRTQLIINLVKGLLFYDANPYQDVNGKSALLLAKKNFEGAYHIIDEYINKTAG